MINDRNYNNIMLSKQMNQNNLYLVPYKGVYTATNREKMSENMSKLRFSEYFGHLIQLNSSL